MEAASEEKLASVSDLVTVFENSRYGALGWEGSACPLLASWAVQALQPREQGQGPWGPQRAALSLGLPRTPLLTGQWATWSWAPRGLGECGWAEGTG